MTTPVEPAMHPDQADSEHPERSFIRQIVASGSSGIPVTTNPLAQALDMRIEAARDGYVQASYRVDHPFTQGNGYVQGGIVSAMLDFGMVFAAFTRVPRHATIATVSQTTNYFRAAERGTFLVEAALERVGRTLINARATLIGADSKVVANATAPIAVIAQRVRSGSPP